MAHLVCWLANLLPKLPLHFPTGNPDAGLVSCKWLMCACNRATATTVPKGSSPAKVKTCLHLAIPRHLIEQLCAMLQVDLLQLTLLL
jgi:hypothetical protein